MIYSWSKYWHFDRISETFGVCRSMNIVWQCTATELLCESSLWNVFVHFLRCISLNLEIYLPIARNLVWKGVFKIATYRSAAALTSSKCLWNVIVNTGILTKYLKHLGFAGAWILYGNAVQQKSCERSLWNVIVHFVKCICLNLDIYLSKLQEILCENCNLLFMKCYLSKLWNVFVQIRKCICTNCEMYLSKLWNVLVWISRNIVFGEF